MECCEQALKALETIDSALTIGVDRTLMDAYAVRDMLLDIRNVLTS